jgi:hypothetical protein
MNKRQKAKRNAYEKMLSVLSENKSITSGYEALENNIATFEKQVADIDDTNKIAVGGKGKGNQSKNQALENLVTHLVALCQKGWAWAMATNNPELVDLYGVVKTDFDGLDWVNVVATAENLVKSIEDNAAKMRGYNVTEDRIVNVKRLIADYKEEGHTPTLKIKKTAEANRKLDKLFVDTDVTVKKIVSLINGEYYDSNAEFVGIVQRAKLIDDLGHRGTRVTMYISTADGKPMADVLGDILEMTGEEQLSDANGEILFEEMKSGNYTYELSHGEKKKQGKFSLKAGEQLKIKVVF